MKAFVTGATGFLGSHVARVLSQQGANLRLLIRSTSNLKNLEGLNAETAIGDLRDPYFVRHVIDRRFDEIYQLAADMGGAGYIFTGEHDADVMHNSASINLNVVNAAHARNNKRIFYSSSACIYPEYKQMDADVIPLKEDDAYPAQPQDAYGWEKLIAERLCIHYRQDYGIDTRIVRFHNIFGRRKLTKRLNNVNAGILIKCRKRCKDRQTTKRGNGVWVVKRNLSPRAGFQSGDFRSVRPEDGLFPQVHV